ncbi:MAG: metalloregulator ArsR/SmtB family transcription factor [Alphaproteobacteria bacterium]|nr:metalloregulator ArsR/SmtB family transcription factor [Alphaproteobacteria bacterium]
MLNNNSDRLSEIFGALADPTRRAILVQLTQGPTTVGALQTPTPMSAPALSRHLKVLERAGLISREVEAQWRRCRLQAAGLRDAAEWIAEYRSFWDDKFDSLDAYLEETGKDSRTNSTRGAPDNDTD